MRDFQQAKYPKNCVVVDAILQLSCTKSVFEGARFSYPGFRLRDIHATADGNRITAHACCHLQNPPWGRVLLRNYSGLCSSKRAGKHPQIGPRSAQNLAQVCLRRLQLTASSFTSGGSFQTSVDGLNNFWLVHGHFYFDSILGARTIRNFGYKELRAYSLSAPQGSQSARTLYYSFISIILHYIVLYYIIL